MTFCSWCIEILSERKNIMYLNNILEKSDIFICFVGDICISFEYYVRQFPRKKYEIFTKYVVYF